MILHLHKIAQATTVKIDANPWRKEDIQRKMTQQRVPTAESANSEKVV